MIKILVATPSAGYVKARYCGSMIRLFSYFPMVPIKGHEKEEKSLHYALIEGSVIAQSRQDFVVDALKGGYSHLLFVDDDMGFREGVLHMLLERDLPIVSCNYRMKVAPCPFTARSLDKKYWVETTDQTTGLEQVFMNGFGFSLIKREVLEKMNSPYFMPYFTHENGKYSTEDTPFFIQLNQLGIPVYIDHDASKLVYHVGNWCFGYDDKMFTPDQKLPFAERNI